MTKKKVEVKKEEITEVSKDSLIEETIPVKEQPKRDDSPSSFLERHMIMVDVEGEQKKQFNLMNALAELYAWKVTQAQQMELIKEGMAFIANEWDKENTNKILMPNDKGFESPIKM